MRSTWPSVVCILGMGVSAAVTVLTVPYLVRGPGDVSPWVAATSAVLFVGLAVAARRCSPARRP